MNQRWQVASQSLSHCPPFSYIIVAYDPTMFCFVQLIFLDYDTRFQNRSTPQCSFLQNKNIRTTIRFSMADKIHTQKHSSIKYVENGLCLLFVIYRNIPRIRTTPSIQFLFLMSDETLSPIFQFQFSPPWFHEESCLFVGYNQKRI